ncbi:MAG: DNA alkylation repair protein [Pikeienuella sp.]
MEPFKNLISEDVVTLIGLHLSKAMPDLDQDAFIASILPHLDALELKQRVQFISEQMLTVLPSDVRERNKTLVTMLHPDKLTSAGKPSSEDGLCGWGIWPLTDVIGRSGLDDLDNSMSALKEFTMRGTSEFDVRPFIAADPSRAMSIMLDWAGDSNEHVRRLASEGSRPRLPWGMQLKSLITDPTLTMPILKALRDDPSEYVRRSVANHLNDIAKDHPDLVAKIAGEWMQGASKDRQKLVRHACRSLIKQGHKETLAVFGLGPPSIAEPQIHIVTPTVEFGKTLEFNVTLSSSSQKPQKLLIDYVVHHHKANGTLAPKVFKWKQTSLQPNEKSTLTRKHPMRPITTRKYYQGQHALSLRINGQDFGWVGFELEI